MRSFLDLIALLSVHLSLTAFACVSISQMYKYWTVVATDMTEKDARTYVRMNWRDMRPKSVALTVRNDHPDYKNLTDDQFEALWYRTTLDEFHANKAAFLAEEAAASEIEKAREKADRETEQKRKEREIVAEA